MTVLAYRLVKAEWAKSAFDGEGAKYHPGRWNSRGTPMVYTAESRALAMLEIMANFDAEDLLIQKFVAIEVHIPEDCILAVNEALPGDWRESPPPLSTRAIGDEWASSKASAVLAVPSVILPAETNFLINPAHRDIEKIETTSPEPIDIDPRLIR